MIEKFIKIRFNLKCNWEGFPPEYRIYVNDELFTERTFNIQLPFYYKEMLQIKAVPGRYTIKLDVISPQENNLTISDTYIEYGNGKVHNNTEFEIL